MGEQHNAVDQEEALNEKQDSDDIFLSEIGFGWHIVQGLGGCIIGQVGIPQQRDGLHDEEYCEANGEVAVHFHEVSQLRFAVYPAVDAACQETETGIAVDDHAGNEEHEQQQHRIGQGGRDHSQKHQRKKAGHQDQRIAEDTIQEQ